MNNNDTKLNLEKILDFSKPIIYLDIESSQHYFFAPKIIQIAAIKTFNNEIIDQINYWSNPRQKVEPRILKMVGRTQKFLNDKKSNSFVYRRMLDFIGDNTQVVVFGDYDQVILDFQAKRFKVSRINLIDIQKTFYSKVINSKRNQISLRLAANTFNIEDLQKEVHNALLDARMLFYIVQASRLIDVKELRKNFLSSMITPRLKEFKTNKDFEIRKVDFKIDENFKLNYFNINSYQKSISDEDEKNTKNYIDKIECQFYQYNNNDKKFIEIVKVYNFNEFNQEKISLKIRKFCLEIIDSHMKNSIFIYKNGFQHLHEAFRTEYNALPIYYYIPHGHFELYAKDIQSITSIKDLLKDSIKINLIMEMVKSKILNI